MDKKLTLIASVKNLKKSIYISFVWGSFFFVFAFDFPRFLERLQEIKNYQ